jgi:hypothetical protein
MTNLRIRQETVYLQFYLKRKPDSVVGIVTSYWLESPGFESWQRNFLFSTVICTGSGANHASCSMGARFVCRWNIDHLPPSSAEVTNEWNCTCAPPV